MRETEPGSGPISIPRDARIRSDLVPDDIKMWAKEATPGAEFVYSTGPGAGRLRGAARVLANEGVVRLHCRRVNGALHYFAKRK